MNSRSRCPSARLPALLGAHRRSERRRRAGVSPGADTPIESRGAVARYGDTPPLTISTLSGNNSNSPAPVTGYWPAAPARRKAGFTSGTAKKRGFAPTAAPRITKPAASPTCRAAASPPSAAPRVGQRPRDALGSNPQQAAVAICALPPPTERHAKYLPHQEQRYLALRARPA
jgi:hypothetical protein